MSKHVSSFALRVYLRRKTTFGPSAAHRERSPDWGERLPILQRDPEPHGLGARLAAIAHVELAKDRRDMVVHRLLGDEQSGGDVGVTKSPRHELEHLQLPCSEAGGIL